MQDSGGTLNGGVDTITKSLTLTVTAVNDAPITDDVGAGGAEDAASIAITITGADVDGTVTDFSLTSLPANGALYLDPALTTVVATGTNYAATGQALTLYFVPAANWNGVTTFQYAARDAQAAIDATPATATITVTPVNDAPTTSPVTLTAIAEDSGPRLITQAELLANASDVDGPSLSATGIAISSGNGSLVDNGNGTWTYTPAANDDTAVSFSYTVTDGSLTAAGSATLDITPVNDAPTFAIGTGKAATPVTILGDNGYAVAVQPDGKLLVAGMAAGTGWDFAIMRYNADGSLDTSFGNGGIVKTDFAGGSDQA